jgi:thioredoxin reductase (NADPH)
MYDVIIIGKGPAGLSAALYTVRANMKTLIIGRNDSRLKKAEKIDNYFGFSGTISGEKLLQEGEQQALRLGAEIVEDEVISLVKGDFLEVVTSKKRYVSKALLLATGQPHKVVNIKNLTEYEGRGISYCSTCDGFFYNNLKVGVLGFKDYAVHEAEELLAYTKNITIFTNGKSLDISEKYKDTAQRFNINTKSIEKVDGAEFLERINFNDGSSEEIQGIFVAYDSASSVDFARKLGILTDGNSVVVDRKQQTNLEGVFAAGDCTDGMKQISTAVGQGAVAGKAIIDYLRSL